MCQGFIKILNGFNHETWYLQNPVIAITQQKQYTNPGLFFAPNNARYARSTIIQSVYRGCLSLACSSVPYR